MPKGLLTTIVICIYLVLSLQITLLYAASQGNPIVMQDHIEKVKRKNPTAYQEMVDKAGGTITNCLSCHIDMKMKKNVPGQANPR